MHRKAILKCPPTSHSEHRVNKCTTMKTIQWCETHNAQKNNICIQFRKLMSFSMSSQSTWHIDTDMATDTHTLVTGLICHMFFPTPSPLLPSTPRQLELSIDCRRFICFSNFLKVNIKSEYVLVHTQASWYSEGKTNSSIFLQQFQLFPTNSLTLNLVNSE